MEIEEATTAEETTEKTESSESTESTESKELTVDNIKPEMINFGDKSRGRTDEESATGETAEKEATTAKEKAEAEAAEKEKEAKESTESKESKDTSEKTTTSEEAKADDETAKETSTSEAATETEKQTDKEFFTGLSEDTGLELTSDEDIISGLKSYAKLKKQVEEQGDPLENLSQAIKEAIQIEKNGGDLADHFRRAYADYENMSDKEILRHKFFKDNLKVAKEDPELANLKFENNYARDRKLIEEAKRYEQMPAFDTSTEEGKEEKDKWIAKKEEFFDRNGNDIELLKREFEFDSKSARSELIDWQKTAKPEVPTQTGMTDQEAETIVQNHLKNADKSLKDFDGIALPLDKDDDDFTVGLNDKTRPVVEEWVRNPTLMLKEMGIEGNEIDTDLLTPIAAVIAEIVHGELGSKLKAYVLDKFNAKTIETQLEHPKDVDTTDEGGEKQKDEWEKVAEGAEKAREERGLSK